MDDDLRSHSCDNCDGIDPASCAFVPGGVDELRRGYALRTVDAWSHYAKHWRERAEKAEAAFTAPDAAVYNLVSVAARNEHTRSWLASQGLVVMEQAAYDAGLADLRRLRGEADLRAEKAEAAIDRVHKVHRIHWCEVDGHKLDRTPNPCVNDGFCMCGQRDPCPTLEALDPPPEFEIIEMTHEEWETARDNDLAKLGCTLEALQEMACTGDYATPRHRALWLAIKPVPLEGP